MDIYLYHQSERGLISFFKQLIDIGPIIKVQLHVVLILEKTDAVINLPYLKPR